MAANPKETTAIIRENAADHALRPFFMRFEWTRCIRVAKTKVLNSFAVSAKLICTFVFAYACCWSFHALAHIYTLKKRTTLRAVTHQRISETRAGRVEKIAKFLTRQTHVGNALKTRYKRVGYAWCTSGARRCTSLKVCAFRARLG